MYCQPTERGTHRTSLAVHISARVKFHVGYPLQGQGWYSTLQLYAAFKDIFFYLIGETIDFIMAFALKDFVTIQNSDD